MGSLADIELEISNVLAVAEELPEDQVPAALDYLENLAIQESEKIDAISFVTRKRMAEIEWIKDEEKRLRSRRQAMEKRLAEFKMYIRDLMIRNGLQKIKGAKGTLYVRQFESVEVEQVSALPEKFVNIKIEYQPDKAKIKQAIKDGEYVAGAAIVSKLSAVIK